MKTVVRIIEIVVGVVLIVSAVRHLLKNDHKADPAQVVVVKEHNDYGDSLREAWERLKAVL
jgi:hypothetical protein